MSYKDDDLKWDIFLSHASEDKESFVRALAHSLQEQGCRVWFDEFVLGLGDSLRRSIQEGLSKSAYGVVILSHHFFKKEWAQWELDGLNALEISGAKRILPVWHNIAADEVKQYSPSLGDRRAVSSELGVAKVAEEILRELRPPTRGVTRTEAEAYSTRDALLYLYRKLRWPRIRHSSIFVALHRVAQRLNEIAGWSAARNAEDVPAASGNFNAKASGELRSMASMLNDLNSVGIALHKVFEATRSPMLVRYQLQFGPSGPIPSAFQADVAVLLGLINKVVAEHVVSTADASELALLVRKLEQELFTNDSAISAEADRYFVSPEAVIHRARDRALHYLQGLGVNRDIQLDLGKLQDEVTILCDEVQFEELLFNIMSNIRHARSSDDPEQPRIKVSVAILTEVDDRKIFSIYFDYLGALPAEWRAFDRTTLGQQTYALREFVEIEPLLINQTTVIRVSTPVFSLSARTWNEDGPF